jgi:eukaryotic-like serine/threonine-protein kinase
MNAPTGRDRLIRFSVFELDVDSGELFKQGRKVKLQGQPFEVFLALLDRPGEVVSREELKQRVWPSDTAGDFDQGLNRAINKLREALGDSAESPQFVETLPRRGYRFISPIQGNNRAQPELIGSRVQVPPPAPIPTFGPSKEGHHGGFSQRTWQISLLLAVLTFLAVKYVLLQRAPQGTPTLTDKDKIVLADFINTTGDPVFDGTLRQGLAIQLDQSPFLSLISEERIHKVLPLMGQPADARLTPELAREVCVRTGSAAVLEGSIATLGSQYVLGLRAKNCRTGDLLDDEQMQAVRKEDVLNALSQIASRFRSRVGESLATIKQHDTPLAEATTSSLEALRAYSAGRRAFSQSGTTASLPLIEHAVEIDPKFAMAYADLGHRYGEMGESDLSAESISKAYQLRNRTSDAEKFYIAASYDLRVTGNLEKAQQTCESWAQTYPREMLPHAFLAGIIYMVSGKYDKAIEESKRAIELDPDSAISYDILAYSQESLDRFGEEENALQRASERKLEMPFFIIHRYDMAFMRNDKAEMERQLTLGRSKSLAGNAILNHEAFVLAYGGHLQQARMMSQRAAALAEQSAQVETAALFKTGAALREAFFGNAREARSGAMAALELSKDREVEYGAAAALAISGDSSRSQALANDLERRFGEDTSVRFSYVPELRAFLAMNQREPAKAIELLGNVLPYEFGKPRSSTHGSFGALYPIYARGEVYLAAHRGIEAVTEFQKILNHRGIVVSDPIGALAHLQIGRAFVLAGDKTRARTAYQDFLTLWRDADPDIPILRKAKAEYAKIQ